MISPTQEVNVFFEPEKPLLESIFHGWFDVSIDNYEYRLFSGSAVDPLQGGRRFEVLP